jgi:hypothetical protein
MLAGAVKLWPPGTARPSPAATDWKGSSRPGQRRGQLSEAVILPSSAAGPADPESDSTSGRPRDWRTPQAAVVDPKPAGTKLHGRTPKDPQVGLADQVMADWPTPRMAMVRQNRLESHHVGATPSGAGSLNPAWVAQLVGLPDGWIDVEMTPQLLTAMRAAEREKRDARTPS